MARVMRLARAGALVLAAPLVAYAVWYSAGLFSHGGVPGSLLLLPIPLVALTLALLLAWFGWRGDVAAHRWRIAGAAIGGIVLGSCLGLAGCVGPMVLQPDSNQGPLLGVLFTGPLGFVAGCVAGAYVAGRLAPAGTRRD